MTKEEKMIVIIAGDRNCTDYELLCKAIKESKFKIKKIIHGGAKGADALGARYAKENKIPVQSYPADWKDLKAPGAVIKENKYGKYNAHAGFFRNQIMAESADALIALQPNGDTSGTQDMVKRAKEQELKIFVYPSKKEVQENKTYEYEF